MKKKVKLLLFIFISIFFLFSCSKDNNSSSLIEVDNNTNYLFVLNSASSTLSRINLSTWDKEDNFGNLGTAYGANSFATDNNYIYVINYADQNLIRLNPNNGEKIIYKDLSGYSNLYEIKIKDGYAYLTVSGNNKLLKLNLSNKEILEYSVGTYPEGMCFDDDNLYIACSGYTSWGDPYKNSTIYKVNTQTNSIEKIIEEETYKNSQHLKVLDNYLFVAFTGEYDANASYYYKNSCLKVYGKNSLELVQTFEQGDREPPFIFLCSDGEYLYACSSGEKFFTLKINDFNDYDWKNSYANTSFTNIDKIFYLNECLIMLEASYTQKSSIYIFKNESKVNSLKCGIGSSDVLFIKNI